MVDPLSDRLDSLQIDLQDLRVVYPLTDRLYSPVDSRPVFHRDSLQVTHRTCRVGSQHANHHSCHLASLPIIRRTDHQVGQLVNLLVNRQDGPQDSPRAFPLSILPVCHRALRLDSHRAPRPSDPAVNLQMPRADHHQAIRRVNHLVCLQGDRQVSPQIGRPTDRQAAHLVNRVGSRLASPLVGQVIDPLGSRPALRPDSHRAFLLADRAFSRQVPQVDRRRSNRRVNRPASPQIGLR